MFSSYKIKQQDLFVIVWGGVNFNYLPRRGESQKLQKGWWKYGAGAGLLKKGGVTFAI